jgi:S-adenosylmethionine synthetase
LVIPKANIPILAVFSSAIHEQSADINQGVDRAIQKSKVLETGMMFGMLLMKLKITLAALICLINYYKN